MLKNKKWIVLLVVVCVVVIAIVAALLMSGRDNNQFDPTNRPHDDSDDWSQKINNAQLTLYALESDVIITLDSEYFKSTKDLIGVNSDKVNNKSTAFITEIEKIETSVIGKIDSNYSYGDVIHIESASKQSMKMRCRIFGDTINLSVSSHSASAVAMSMGSRYVNIQGATGLFSYDLTDPIDNGSMHITIDGHLEEQSDIEIYRNKNVYTVKSTSELNGIMVVVSDMGAESAAEDTMVDSMDRGYVYTITINDDGTVTIKAETSKSQDVAV